MKNFIDVVTLESYPDAISVDIENIANFYPKKEVFTVGTENFTTYSCIDLKVPVWTHFKTLHCILPYSVLSSYISQTQSKYLTRSEAKWYFYFFLISFPFINVMVKIFVDIVWSMFK